MTERHAIAPWPPVQLGLGAVLVVMICMLLVTDEAAADAKTCCNLTSGEFETAESPAACEAMGNRVAVGSNPQSFAQAAICFQNAAQQANDALRNSGVDLSTLGQTVPSSSEVANLLQRAQEGVGRSDEPAQYQCCNVPGASFVGTMAASACRAKGHGHLPDTPENLEAVQVCRKAPAQGGAWDKKDFVANIQGGDFESWKDAHQPAGFKPYGVPASIVASGEALDMQTTFRSSDAHTGQYSLRMKNYDFLQAVPQREAAIARSVLGTRAPSAPAGVISCADPCPDGSGDAGGDGVDIFASLEAESIESHICMAYKGYVAPNDELSLNVVAFEGTTAVAGVNQAPGNNAVITDSSSDWVRLALPISAPRTQAPESGRVGLQAQVQPRDMMANVTSSGIPGQVSSETDVLLDSIHFCSLVDITAYQTAAIAGRGGIRVPDSEEETLGVQAFVNLDNDDKDEFWDRDDPDGVAEDDDLVRLRLELPMNSFGTVEFRAPGVGRRYALWEDRNKTQPFELANQELEVEELLRADDRGKRFVRDVWVEAIAPSTATADEDFVFSFKNRLNQDKEISDRIVFTALGVEKVTWVGNDTDKTAPIIDKDDNWPATAEGKGLRVFPGKVWKGSAPSAKSNQELKVEVKLSAKPTRPVKVHLKSFDVDDPTTEDPILDDESASEDNRHTEDPGRAGMFIDSGDETHTVELTKQSVKTGFKVGLRPGDNYRIVAGFNKAMVENLRNDDAELLRHGPRHTTKIVDPDLLAETDSVSDARIREHEHYESPVLTIWRRIHGELDTMDVVAQNDEMVTVDKVTPGDDVTEKDGTTRQQSYLRLTSNLYYSELPKEFHDELPKAPANAHDAHRNSFRGGKLFVGAEVFDVTWNTAYEAGYVDVIRVTYDKSRAPLTIDDFKAGPVRLQDDDPQRDGDPVPPINFELTHEQLARAYIKLDLTTLPNDTKPVPFKLHFKGDSQEYLKKQFEPHFKNKAFDNDPEFWVLYILNAFQGMPIEDGDGSRDPGKIAGQTDANQSGLNVGKDGYGIVVFQESGRDLATTKGYGAGWGLKTVPAHEIAHLFGVVHADGWVMSFDDMQRPGTYNAVTLKKIRTAEYP